MARRAGIGQAEMEVLRYVAEHRPVTVREVAEHLAETKGQTRTTALNVMERLRKKGHLVRRKVEGVYSYSPAVPRQQLLQGLVRDFVQQMLGGSIEPFMAYLAQDARLTEAELEELRRLVEGLDIRKEEGHEPAG
jgi:predicted transcriptional regulator